MVECPDGKKLAVVFMRFTIRDLLWLTVCVASFFGGWHWEQIAKAVRPEPVVTFNSDYHILAGRTGLFDAHMPVTRMTIADPNIVTITPKTQTTFTVTAERAGTTIVQLWSDTTYQTVTLNVTVK